MIPLNGLFFLAVAATAVVIVGLVAAVVAMDRDRMRAYRVAHKATRRADGLAGQYKALRTEHEELLTTPVALWPASVTAHDCYPVGMLAPEQQVAWVADGGTP